MQSRSPHTKGFSCTKGLPRPREACQIHEGPMKTRRVSRKAISSFVGSTEIGCLTAIPSLRVPFRGTIQDASPIHGPFKPARHAPSALASKTVDNVCELRALCEDWWQRRQLGTIRKIELRDGSGLRALKSPSGMGHVRRVRSKLRGLDTDPTSLQHIFRRSASVASVSRRQVSFPRLARRWEELRGCSFPLTTMNY